MAKEKLVRRRDRLAQVCLAGVLAIALIAVSSASDARAARVIPLPRPLLALLAIGVAACTFTNGVLAIGGSLHPERVVIALAMFAIAFLLTILDRQTIMSPLLSG